MRKFLFKYVENWFGSDAFGLAAAFAFYALFAIAPLLAFAVALAAYFLGAEEAREGASEWLEDIVSQEQAASILELVQVEKWSGLNWIYTALTGVIFLWAASLAFTRLRVAVNIILGNEADSIRHAIWQSVSGRALSMAFTVVAGCMTALLIVLAAGGPGFAWLGSVFEGGAPGWAIHALSLLFLALGMIAVLRLLSLDSPSWAATLYGTGFFMVAFQVGRFLFELQMSHSELASAYGAANTLVFFLFWIFYSAQALLLGVNLAAILDNRGITGDMQKQAAEE